MQAHSVVYRKSGRPQPVVLFELVKGIMTGQPPGTGDLRHEGSGELHGGGAG